MNENLDLKIQSFGNNYFSLLTSFYFFSRVKLINDPNLVLLQLSDHMPHKISKQSVKCMLHVPFHEVAVCNIY